MAKEVLLPDSPGKRKSSAKGRRHGVGNNKLVVGLETLYF
jgi:hypothetical protein